MANLRKPLKVIGLVFLVLVLFVGYRLFLNVQNDRNSEALMKIDAEWASTAATKDLDKVVSYYAPDAMLYPPHGPIAIGRNAAKKVWAALLADPSFTIAWTAVNARTDGKFGFTTGSYKATFKGPSGNIINDTGKYVCVWMKRRDGWKAVHDIWNSDLAEQR